MQWCCALKPGTCLGWAEEGILWRREGRRSFYGRHECHFCPSFNNWSDLCYLDRRSYWIRPWAGRLDPAHKRPQGQNRRRNHCTCRQPSAQTRRLGYASWDHHCPKHQRRRPRTPNQSANWNPFCARTWNKQQLKLFPARSNLKSGRWRRIKLHKWSPTCLDLRNSLWRVTCLATCLYLRSPLWRATCLDSRNPLWSSSK